MLCITTRRQEVLTAVVRKFAVVHALPLVRAGLRLLIEQHDPGAEIVEAASLIDLAAGPSGVQAQAVLLVDQGEWTARKPLMADRCLIIGLIGPSGSCPSPDLLRATGAKSWAPLDAEPDDLLDMIASLARGEERFATAAAPQMRGLDRLTERQVEVLTLMTSGLANKEIARKLGVQETTIKAHVASILVKLECRRRTEAVGRFLSGFARAAQTGVAGA